MGDQRCRCCARERPRETWRKREKGKEIRDRKGAEKRKDDRSLEDQCMSTNTDILFEIDSQAERQIDVSCPFSCLVTVGDIDDD